MFAVIYLPRFQLQTVLRHGPDLWQQAVALVDPERTIPTVCEMTDPARLAGVVEGFTATQAMARCPHLVIRHRSRTQEAIATDALLECAFAYSPHVESTASGICTLDLQGLARLQEANDSTLATWATELRESLRSLGLTAHIGIARAPQVARHAAKWTEGIEVVRDPKAFVERLPTSALDPSSDVVRILGKWGIRTVGEFLALGQAAVIDRLGLEALALFAAASPTAIRPLHLAQPSARYEEWFDFEHEVERLEALLFVLRRFVDQLALRLERAGLVASTLTFRLRLESGEKISRLFRVPSPTRNPDTLFRMLHTHLENLRTDSTIMGVGLAAGPTPPEQRQFGLFESVLRDPRQFQETLARLSALLGADRVGTPARDNSHRPESFRLLPPEFEKSPPIDAGKGDLTGTQTFLRRFRPPMSANIETETHSSRATTISNLLGPGTPLKPASAPGTPLSLRCTAVNGRIKIALGPWKSSGNWWEPASWEREEWDVSLTNGSAWRVVRQATGWTVEGVID